MSKTLRTISICFFATVGAQLSSCFEQSDNIPSIDTYLDSNTRSDLNFYFTPVDEDLITNFLNKISSGIENILNKLLKQIKHYYCATTNSHY